VGLVLIGVLIISSADGYLPKEVGFTAALLLFLVQFPAFQTVIAFMYPNECSFSKALGTIDYIGKQIVNIDNNTAGVPTSQERIIVECGLSPCAWFSVGGPINAFCGQQGGREWYASLCHVSALALVWAVRKAFILNYHDGDRGAISTFDCTLIYINIFDIQDFFTLFLEDDVIRNFWGRDMCDTDYGCSGGGWIYGFIPHGSGLWTFVLLSFWISNLALGITIGNYINHLLSQSPITEQCALQRIVPLSPKPQHSGAKPNNPGDLVRMRDSANGSWKRGIVLQMSPLTVKFSWDPYPCRPGLQWQECLLDEDAKEEKKYSFFKHVLKCLCDSAQGKALMFLICIDGPFLLARTLCSMRYSVLASTLSMKNIVCICGELMVSRGLLANLFCCCCRSLPCARPFAEHVMKQADPTIEEAIEDFGVMRKYLNPDGLESTDEQACIFLIGRLGDLLAETLLKSNGM
jgi:hypothetical protein